MLTKIEDREIMTIWDAKKKYASKYILMIITEKIGEAYDSLGYVIYTANDKRDFKDVPREDFVGKPAGFFDGYSVDPQPTVDRVVLYD